MLAASGFFSQRAKASYEETLGRVRLTNLTSLCEFSRDISGGLRLLAVSADNSLADSAAYVRARAMGAIGCLNTFDSENVENISRFLNGAYSFAEDFSGSDSQRKTAVLLSDYAQGIYYHLNDVSSAVMNGLYSLIEYSNPYSSTQLPYFEEYVDFANGDEKEIFEMITPVSARAGGYSLLAGKEKISEDAARNTASKVVDINSALWRESESLQTDIEVYSLAYGDIAVYICKTGGMLCRLVNPMPCARAFYSLEEAEKKAEDFLKQQGFINLTVINREKSEFTASFLLAPEVNGILLLTAAVELDVCLASGEITYFDASEYIKNYRSDLSFNLGSPDLSGILPPNLVLNGVVNCLVNIDGRERLCYLAVCSFQGDTVLLYIDSSEFKVIETQIA